MPGDQRTTLGVPPQTGSIVLNCVGQDDWPMISRNSAFCTSHFTSGMTDAHLTLHLAPRGPQCCVAASWGLRLVQQAFALLSIARTVFVFV